MPVVVVGVTGCIGAYKACEVLRELQKRDVDVHVVMTENATRFVTPLTLEALSRHPVFMDQFALGEGERHPAHQPGRRRRPAAGGARHREHPRQVRAGHRGRRALDALHGDHGAGAGGAGHERQHVPPPRGAGEPGDPAVARRGRRRARLGLPGLRLAGQGPAGRDVRHRGGGDGRPGPPPRPGGRDGARHRRPHRRGHRPGPLRLQPLVAAAWATAWPRRRATAARASSSSRGRRPLPPPARRGPGAGALGRGDGGGGGPPRGRGHASWPWRRPCPTTARPRSRRPSSRRRTGRTRLELVRTPDILRSLGASKGERFLVGFAAETDAVLENARRKRTEKRLDLIVANDVSARRRGLRRGAQRGHAHRRAGRGRGAACRASGSWRSGSGTAWRRSAGLAARPGPCAAAGGSGPELRARRGPARPQGARAVLRVAHGPGVARTSEGRAAAAPSLPRAACPSRPPVARVARRRRRPCGRAADPAGRSRRGPPGGPRGPRRLPALQARRRPQDDRVRPGQSRRAPDVRGRGAGRGRGRAGPGLRGHAPASS